MNKEEKLYFTDSGNFEDGETCFHDITMLSAVDMAERYGRSRQLFEKWMSRGKIPYQQLSCGKIALKTDVEEFLSTVKSKKIKNREGVLVDRPFEPINFDTK